MNYKVLTGPIVLALLVVATSSARVSTSIQQPQKLTFKMELCGIGAFSSHQIYTASDGTTLNVDTNSHLTLDKAKKALAKELKGARRISDRQDLLDEAGKRVGQRIIFATGNTNNERIVWLSLKDKFLYKIEAMSLRHINDFREWEKRN